jgi:hypothetical protein
MHNYKYKLYIDDLPSATLTRNWMNSAEVDYSEGIPLGVYSNTNDVVLIYNHLNITIYTHTT